MRKHSDFQQHSARLLFFSKTQKPVMQSHRKTPYITNRVYFKITYNAMVLGDL